jgi:hypothetical protein
MVKILATILTFILTTSLTWGQADTVFIKYNKDKFEEKLNYKTDTVIFDTPNARQILYGTTVLPWTNSQQIAKNFGIVLQTVTGTDCKQSGKPTGNEVVNIAETDTSLKIELKIFGNCCHSFLCDLEIVDDSIVNLKYYGYGATYCSCDCCYGLTYNIEKWKFDDYKLLKSVMVNGDRRTIKTLK